MNKDEIQENQEPPEFKKGKAVDVRKISFEGILGAGDVQMLTGLSRVTLWREEKAGRFPARVQLTCNRVGWYGNEIKAWVDSRPRVVEGV